MTADTFKLTLKHYFSCSTLLDLSVSSWEMATHVLTRILTFSHVSDMVFAEKSVIVIEIKSFLLPH